MRAGVGAAGGWVVVRGPAHDQVAEGRPGHDQVQDEGEWRRVVPAGQYAATVGAFITAGRSMLAPDNTLKHRNDCHPGLSRNMPSQCSYGTLY